jgi:hypothetical protein
VPSSVFKNKKFNYVVVSKRPTLIPFMNPYKQHLCVGFEVLKSVESQPTFQRNVSTLLLGLFLHAEDAGDIFLSTDYTELYARR